MSQPTDAAGVRPWAIFLGGLVLAAIFQMIVVSAFGDPAALLQVGEDGSARSFIESELGDDIPIVPDLGHDGQSAYVIARQPFGGDDSDAIGAAGFRYRRWLYPALAGGFGTLAPETTVLGLAAWAAIGFGLSAAALVMIGETYAIRSRLLVLGVYLNVGLALSVVIVTSDALGLGLALSGVAAYRKDRRALAIGLLAAAALTKEQFLIFAIAVAIDAWLQDDRSGAVGYLVVPAGTLVLATALAAAAFGGGGGLNSNVSLPFNGLIEAWPDWSSQYVVLRRSSYLTLLGLAALGPLAVWTRERLIILMSFGWIAGAALAAEPIWREGTDTIRVFAAFWPLIALSATIGFGRVWRQRSSMTSEVA